MLVLTRKFGEEVMIGDNVRVKVTRIGANRVTIAVAAPKEVKIMRKEVADADARRAREAFGYAEGDRCNRFDCAGEIELEPVRDCSCHIAPPCPACLGPRATCPTCGWLERIDG